MTAVTELAACHGVSVLHGRGPAQVTALSEIDFRICEGERVSLFGASGSGKTTLLHVLGGLIVPNAGEVTWRREPLSSLDAVARGRARRTGIAFVFQGANLLPIFTAFENVAFAAHACRSEPDAARDASLDPADLLALVGLADKADALPAELSGGEAQRVAVARALAQQPAMLLCDEPTGHLDSDTGARLLELIDALHGELGFAQVTATHDADVAARFDRAVELTDGRVSHEERFA
ncbi:MAG: ABC transporter ATP-binding protein [Solirubrobacteraceae bacterium]